jgi:hypothetical protein
MSKKVINSLRGKTVRVRRDLIKVEQKHDGYWDDNDDWVEDTSLPMLTDQYIPSNSLGSFIDKPLTEVFTVKADFYGVDLYNKSDGFEVGSQEPKHQVILGGGIFDKMTDVTFLWDADYFEVVVPKVTITTEWLTQEEFNNQKQTT